MNFKKFFAIGFALSNVVLSGNASNATQGFFFKLMPIRHDENMARSFPTIFRVKIWMGDISSKNMNITLTPEQSQIVQQKLQSGRYQDIDDLFVQAFQLLDDWEEHSLTESPDWIASTRTKVDAAIASIAANGGNDGEAVIFELLDKFRQAREASQ